MANQTVTDLETKLDKLFVKDAPKFPEGGKKALVQWAPLLSLVVGVLTLLGAWNLWHWAHVASRSLNYVQTLCGSYALSGGPDCNYLAPSRFSLWLWLGVVFLLAEGILYLAAYTGLRDHKKQGWNYLFYGALVNALYAVISLFTDYDKVGHFLGALVGSAIGFYLLFQIREYYLGKKPVAGPDHKDPTPPADK